MVNWQDIDTVLLDMDGTLLDLNFDNYFWREHVPMRYAQKHSLPLDIAKSTLYPIFREVEGTIHWYCVDYWSDTLELDIAKLKAEVQHLIAVHPHVIDFLSAMQNHKKLTALVTNAHHKSLSLKLDVTSLDSHLDHIICAHDFGLPKEDLTFWDKLKEILPFNNTNTLLIDDSLSVLRSAREYGIKNLLAVYKPDSKTPVRDVEEFDAIHTFKDIMPE